MNEMAEAYAELVDAKREVTDGGDVVLLDGHEIKNPLVEEITTDETVLAGGIGETGGYRVHVAMSEVAAVPAKGIAIEVNGKALEVLNVVERNRATYEITAGDLAAEDT